MPERRQTTEVAIVGTGPAGLMAAGVCARAGCRVTVFEKKRGPARKLLLAGSSGLNIGNDLPLDEFQRAFKGDPAHFSRLFTLFPPAAWLAFLRELGVETFRGSGGRRFVEGMKASPLVRAWLRALSDLGVGFRYSHDWVDFDVMSGPAPAVQLRFSENRDAAFDAVCLALGGGSYEPTPVTWPAVFEKKKVRFEPFRPVNVGFDVAWPAALLEEAEGQPIKNVILSSSLGRKQGDLVITRYGLEGTPIYQLGEVGTVFLDFKPDAAHERLRALARSPKENLSPIRRVQRQFRLSPAALAVIFHCTSREIRDDLDALLARIKRFPIELKNPRPLTEAISSSGGIAFEELDERLMLRRFPGVFVAGEMLDWEAPTGGFLIEACASQGFMAGKGIIEFLEQAPKV